MSACTRSRTRLAFATLLAAFAAACSIQVGPDAPPQGAAPAPAPGGADPNTRVDEVVVVGTSVTGELYVSGAMGLTTVPKDAAGEAILAPGLDVDVKITTPADLTVEVGATECTAPDPNKSGLAVGVILDDSGSMGSSDPQRKRKDATITFLNTLGPEDKVLLTDYGASGSNLRDLLCVATGGTSCSPPQAAFSSDKAALVAATDQIVARGGTPLYESCLQMVPLVDTVTDMRRGILLLSDGKPNSQSKRDACHDAAKAAQVPVFTVGLGPAAEGDAKVDPDAVKVLRELATDTGGSYASANDPSELDRLFQNMGTALARGSCRTTARIREGSQIQPGTKIVGEVSVGANGAKATFEFVAPVK